MQAEDLVCGSLHRGASTHTCVTGKGDVLEDVIAGVVEVVTVLVELVSRTVFKCIVVVDVVTVLVELVSGTVFKCLVDICVATVLVTTAIVEYKDNNMYIVARRPSSSPRAVWNPCKINKALN